MGNPDDWEDRNDAKFMKLYQDNKNWKEIRSLCFTMAYDRIHFWKGFANEGTGVRLLFNKEKLKKDISEANLVCRKVTYPGNDEDISKYFLKDLPFLKRRHFEDEKEFRVVGELAQSKDTLIMGFKASSLVEILIDPRLEEPTAECVKKSIKCMCKGDLEGVEVLQSRMLYHDDWIKQGKCIAGQL